MKIRASVILLAAVAVCSCTSTPPTIPTVVTSVTTTTSSTSTTTAQAQAGLSNIQTFSTFDAFGMKIVSCSPFDGVDEGSFVLSSTTPMKVIADMKIAGATESQDVSVEKDGANWKVSALFPTTGVYQVRVFIKAESDTGNTYSGSVYMTFNATVAGEQKIYSLGSSNGGQKLRVADVKSDAVRWEPYPGTSYASSMTGLVAKDADIPFQGRFIRITKGTPIRFAAYGTIIGGLAVTPDLDVAVSLNGVETQLAAGGMMYIGSSVFTGALKSDVTLSAGPVSLACPAGSSVLINDGKLSSVRLTRESSLVFKGTSVSCTGDVTFSDWGSGRFTELTLGQPADLSIGLTVAPCPAGTELRLEEDRISTIIYKEDAIIRVKGKPAVVKSGWAVSLDARGNVQDTWLAEVGY